VIIICALWPLIRDLLYLRQPRGVVRITAFAEVFMAHFAARKL
jgi:hypothetical protein